MEGQRNKAGQFQSFEIKFSKNEKCSKVLKKVTDNNFGNIE